MTSTEELFAQVLLTLQSRVAFLEESLIVTNESLIVANAAIITLQTAASPKKK